MNGRDCYKDRCVGRGMGVAGAPGRSAVRPRAELVEAVVLEKRLGSLPVIADFSRRLDIAGIIDALCPIREVSLATHGQVRSSLDS